jgi:lysophospholipase L1-like esterase
MTVNPRPIVFTGSSIIAMWEGLVNFFPTETVLNTAISGSQTADLLPQLDALVIAPRPRLVCYYCGSNDINSGVSPTQIAANVARTFDLLNQRLPDLHFVYLAIIRAPQKADRMAQVEDANARIALLAAERPNFHFLDINPVFFTPQGAPRLDFYVEDGLHLTLSAYAALGAYVAPRVLGLK